MNNLTRLLCMKIPASAAIRSSAPSQTMRRPQITYIYTVATMACNFLAFNRTYTHPLLHNSMTAQLR